MPHEELAKHADRGHTAGARPLPARQVRRQPFVHPTQWQDAREPASSTSIEVTAIVIVIRAADQKQARRGDLERVGVARAEGLGLGDDGATQNGGRDGRKVGEGGEHDIERRAQPLGAHHVHINLKGGHLVGEGEGTGG